MKEQEKKLAGQPDETQEKEKYVPNFDFEYTEEELADYWGDTCSGE